MGYCQDLQERVEKHNMGSTPSTKPYIPWDIVYHEEHNTKREAIIREQEIKKKKSRKYIENLINKRS